MRHIPIGSTVVIAASVIKYDDLVPFHGSKEQFELLSKWIGTLRLSSGKAPAGMKKEYDNVLFLKRQVDGYHQHGFTEPSNVKATFQHITPEMFDLINAKLGNYDVSLDELKLANATYINASVMSNATFKKTAQDVDTFLGTLKGFHKNALKGNLKVKFVKKEQAKTAAKYKTDDDTILMRPDKLATGDAYASFRYVVLHEVGHRYLAKNSIKFNHNDFKWATTPYSKKDTMTEEEKFAELFALSHFNYAGKPFDSYKETINLFNKEMA